MPRALRSTPGRVQWSKRFKVVKVDESRRLVFGTASTIEKAGQVVVDHDKDRISVAELERAAYDFVQHTGTLGEMHERIGVGSLVESLVTTEEKRAALGIAGEDVRWWVGFRVEDDATWALVMQGELREFSIGGTAKRIPVGDGTFNLEGLALEEVSLVDLGAGRDVSVSLVKRRTAPGGHRMDIISKLLVLLAAQSQAVTKALPAGKDDSDLKAALEGVNKQEVKTLADVQAALDEDLWTVVLAALDAAAMNPTAPAEEAAPPETPIDAAAEEDNKEEEPVAAAADGEPAPKMEDKEPTAKEAPAVKALRKELATLKAAQEKERATLAKERAELRLDKARQRAADEFPNLGASDDEIAQVLLLCDDVSKAAGDKPVTIPAKTASVIEALLKRTQAMLAESALFASLGTSETGAVTETLGSTEAHAELTKHAKALRKEDPKLTEAQAFTKAVQKHPDLYKKHREELQG